MAEMAELKCTKCGNPPETLGEITLATFGPGEFLCNFCDKPVKHKGQNKFKHVPMRAADIVDVDTVIEDEEDE